MTCIFFNWKFVSFDHLHLFCPLQSPTTASHQSVLCSYELVFWLLFQISHISGIILYFKPALNYYSLFVEEEIKAPNS